MGVCDHSDAVSIQASNANQVEPDAALVQAESALDISGDSAVAEVEEPGTMVLNVQGVELALKHGIGRLGRNREYQHGGASTDSRGSADCRACAGHG